MTFEEALKVLDIEDYKKQIFESNSKGELFHLMDYVCLARGFQENPKFFRKWFIEVVEATKKEWKRPESVYQHIGTIFIKSLEVQNDLQN